MPPMSTHAYVHGDNATSVDMCKCVGTAPPMSIYAYVRWDRYVYVYGDNATILNIISYVMWLGSSADNLQQGPATPNTGGAGDVQHPPTVAVPDVGVGLVGLLEAAAASGPNAGAELLRAVWQLHLHMVVWVRPATPRTFLRSKG